jgi:hypothetical protein
MRDGSSSRRSRRSRANRLARDNILSVAQRGDVCRWVQLPPQQAHVQHTGNRWEVMGGHVGNYEKVV